MAPFDVSVAVPPDFAAELFTLDAALCFAEEPVLFSAGFPQADSSDTAITVTRKVLINLLKPFIITPPLFCKISILFTIIYLIV